jgi:hypothetical protein
MDNKEEECEGCQGDHELRGCARTPQPHSLKVQGSYHLHTNEWKATRPKYLPGIKSLSPSLGSLEDRRGYCYDFTLLHSLLLSTSSFSLQPHFILPWTPFLFLLTHTRLLMRSMLIHALTHALTHAYLCLFMHLLIRLLMHTFAYSCAYSYTSLLTHTQ